MRASTSAKASCAGIGGSVSPRALPTFAFKIASSADSSRSSARRPARTTSDTDAKSPDLTHASALAARGPRVTLIGLFARAGIARAPVIHCLTHLSRSLRRFKACHARGPCLRPDAEAPRRNGHGGPERRRRGGRRDLRDDLGAGGAARLVAAAGDFPPRQPPGPHLDRRGRPTGDEDD